MTPEDIAEFIVKAKEVINRKVDIFDDSGWCSKETDIGNMFLEAIEVIEELLYDNTAEKIANRLASKTIQDIYEPRIKDLKADFEDVKAAHDKLADLYNAVRETVGSLTTLLAATKCPECDGSGSYARYNIYGEVEAVQCQWCHDTRLLLAELKTKDGTRVTNEHQ